MYLPRALRPSQQLDLDVLDDLDELEDPDGIDGADAEEFRQLLLDALAHPDVQAAIRRLTGAPKPAAEPRAARRR